MKNDTDRITYKMKKNRKNKRMDEDSDSSRESLEIELESYRNNKNMCRRKTQNGEQIKFFFNDLPSESPEKKNTKSNPISSSKTNPPALLNLSKKKIEFNFKDILLNYVNSPKYPTKNQEKENPQIERRDSIIYGDPETVLTLNGDENVEESKESKESKSKSKASSSGTSSSHTESGSQSKSKSDSKSKSSSISNSKSNSKSSSYPEEAKKKISNIKSNHKNDNNKEKNKSNKKSVKKLENNSKEEPSFKCTTSRCEDSIKQIYNNPKNKKYKEIVKKKEMNKKKETLKKTESNKKIEIIQKNENKDKNKIKKKVKENIKIDNENNSNNIKYVYNKILGDEINSIEVPKKIDTDRKIQKRKDSFINSGSYKNSLQIINSNSNNFTTATNTQNTQKTHNTNNSSSLQSLKNTSKKFKYNYLCFKDLRSIQKIIIKNRSNSAKKLDIKKDNLDDNFVHNDSTTVMIYKLKNLKLSLDIEKTYIHYFKNLTNLLNQKKRSISQKNIFSNNKKNNVNDEDYCYYPYYIDKNNTLHNKSHVSNLFAKMREHKNCV